MIARRDVLRAAASAAATALTFPLPALATDAPFGGEGFAKAVRAAEALGAGRLGVAVLDTETGRRFDWRGNERFPVTSTFKFVLAAAVLARVDRGLEQLDRRIPVAKSDIVPHAPVTGEHVGKDLTVAALCEAIIVISDNAAANLLLATMDGPAGLTRFAREVGDSQFRLDRLEIALNEATPGDPRDTTTPLAMLGTLDRLLVGDALSTTSRTQLADWLIACRTGDQRIRAGLPKDWRCGDKTGSGGHGTTNDIAIIWPPGRRPVLVASYLTETTASADARNAAHVTVSRGIAAALA